MPFKCGRVERVARVRAFNYWPRSIRVEADVGVTNRKDADAQESSTNRGQLGGAVNPREADAVSVALSLREADIEGGVDAAGDGAVADAALLTVPAEAGRLDAAAANSDGAAECTTVYTSCVDGAILSCVNLGEQLSERLRPRSEDVFAPATGRRVVRAPVSAHG